MIGARTVLLVGLVLTALAGCGNEAREADVDAGESADGTSLADAAAGGGEDASVEVDTAETPDPVEPRAARERFCEDGEDNDEDGYADCDDPDCADQTCCLVELCDDFVDNDMDGLVDCDDPDCHLGLTCCFPPPTNCVVEPAICFDEQVCNSTGECRDPVTVDSYVAAPRWSYVSEFVVPNHLSPERRCCFDLDGDGEFDNGLGRDTAPGLAPLIGDVNELVRELLSAGELTILVEHRRFPESGTGPATLHFWLGHGVGSSSGSDGAAQREEGSGEFVVDSRSFGPSVGSLIQLNSVDTVDFIGSWEAQLVELHWNGPPFDSAAGEGTLRVENPRFEGTFDSTDSRVSVDAHIDGGDFGGMKIGGFIELREVLEPLDHALRECSCVPEINAETPVLTFGDEDGPQYQVSCSRASYDVSACGESDGSLCTDFLNPICETLPGVRVADIDTDGNGVPDALSFGIVLSLVAANVDPEAWITE